MNTNTKTVVSNEEVTKLVAEMKKVSVPLKKAIEQIINDTPISNVIACYDDGGVIVDSEEMATEAAKFVMKGLIGALCYNVIDGYTGNGQKMLNLALDDVDQAASRDANNPNQKSQEILHRKINWACRMDVQQSYRKALQDWSEKLYVAVCGERYPRPVARSARIESVESNVAANLRERIAERNAS
jgi:hypothetical protein